MKIKHRKAAKFTVTLITFASVVGGANAAISVFNDRGSFVSAANPNLTTDFQGSEADTIIQNNSSTNVGIFNVFYTTAGGATQSLNTLRPASANLRLTVDDSGLIQTTGLRFEFSNPITAFGISITALNAEREVWTFDVNGDLFNIADVIDSSSNSDDLSGFAGFISDTPITNISLVNTPLTTTGDLVFFTEAFITESVPEPSSMVFLGLGAFAFISRRKR